jgi:hypothetical protein
LLNEDKQTHFYFKFLFQHFDFIFHIINIEGEKQGQTKQLIKKEIKRKKKKRKGQTMPA